MKKFLEYMLLLILVTSCSSPSVSTSTGSGTGVGNGFAISGIVQTPDGTEASEATVKLIPAGFVAPITTELRQTSLLIDSTDTNGKFTLTVDKPGHYRLWAMDSQENSVVKEIEIKEEQLKYQVDTLKTGVTYPFTIAISSENNTEPATVQLYGSTISRKSDPNSKLTLDLPEGEHYVRISFPNTTIGTRDSVKLEENDTVYITVVNDGIVSSSYQTDSIIVRAILDMNHKSSTPVSSVSTAPVDDDDNGKRITELHMTEIDSLSPAIGGLTLLQSLSINRSSLTSIPARIGELQELKTLDLSDNNITTLPEEIVNLENVDSLNVSGNPLTDVPSEVEQWLQEFCDD